MERKIGEIFEYNGEWYQCIVGCHCPDCAFCNNNCEERERITLGNKLTKEETTGFCTPEFREDGKSVIFKKLEKVGEPYQYIDGIYQEYKATLPFFIRNATYIETVNGFEIKIKQNKEDMEEKKIQHYDCFFDKEPSKSNLKPFSLEAAKQGKPVCTRNGNRARIICFDRKYGTDSLIVALVTIDNIEYTYSYDNDGLFISGKESNVDLMILTQKKEGWVNIVRGSDGKSHMGRGIFQSKEEAEDAIKAFSDNLIDTIKVSWEE